MLKTKKRRKNSPVRNRKTTTSTGRITPRFGGRIRPRFDTLSGTTKVKALPADLPVARPVRLYRNDTGALVAETQSSVDGSYTFNGLSLDQRYFVVAFDPTHLHRAVVADYLTAERIP